MLALERDVRALEAAATCIPVDLLAGQIQALLDRAGWEGWRARVRHDLSAGQCAHALWLNGDGSRRLSILPGERQILIAGEPR